MDDYTLLDDFTRSIEECSYLLYRSVEASKPNIPNGLIECLNDIYLIDAEAISFGLELINDKLTEFCDYLRIAAVFLYKYFQNAEMAEKSFIILSRYDKECKICFLYLAFMKRRNETKYITTSVSELLDKYDKHDDAMWCTIKALCYVSGADGHEVNWGKAIDVMNKSDGYYRDAVDWWEEESIVGDAEKNVAMLLFDMSDKFQIDNTVSRADRIAQAVKDGYLVPKKTK